MGNAAQKPPQDEAGSRSSNESNQESATCKKTPPSSSPEKQATLDKSSSRARRANEATPLRWAARRRTATRSDGLAVTRTESCRKSAAHSAAPLGPACCCCCEQAECEPGGLDWKHFAAPCCASTPQQLVSVLPSEPDSHDYQTFGALNGRLKNSNESKSPKTIANAAEVSRASRQLSSELGAASRPIRPKQHSARASPWSVAGAERPPVDASALSPHLGRRASELDSLGDFARGRCECGAANSCCSTPTDATKAASESNHVKVGPPKVESARGATTTQTVDASVGIRNGDQAAGEDKENVAGASEGLSATKTSFENSKLGRGIERQRRPVGEPANQSEQHNDRLTWKELALKYGRMPHQQQDILTAKSGTFQQAQMAGPTSDQVREHDADPNWRREHVRRGSRKNRSCLCHIFCALAQTLFPILGAFRNYSVPGDLLTDLVAGLTVAVLHIPQGMAYGLLSGVEPIYGLYVSFIPVAVMSLMSKSRHASYGTFAIISMLLVNIVVQVRTTIQEEQASANASSLVIRDNHLAPEAAQLQHKSQLLKQLLEQTTNEPDTPRTASADPNSVGGHQNLLVDAGNLFGVADSVPTNIEILSCVCIVCGLMHVTMSLLRLGVLTLMFSDQLVSGFTTAGAVHVLTSQLAGLFDLSLAPISEELFKCGRIWWQFAQALARGEYNQTTALLSLGSIAFLLGVKELAEPILRRRFKRLTCLPSELVLMAVMVCCSGHFRLEADFGVKTVGHVPSGLPEPRMPSLELVPYVLKDSLVVALITFAINLSIARVYAKKFRYELDPNQELFALGSANLVGSFFSCFPCASSLSRSSVQSSLNVKSQLCPLFSCLVVFTIVCYFAHILFDLPKSTLSCIIVVALKGILMQIRDLYDNWRLSKLDATVWAVTFVSVIAFGVALGLLVGIVASLFMIFLRLLTPNHSVLGRLPGTEIYVDKDAFVECEEVGQVKIFRFNSALCYLNRTILKSKIEKLLPTIYEPAGFRALCSQFHADQAANWPASDAPNRTGFLVIDCSALSYCDFSGVSTLIELIDDLAEKKVCVLLAACPIKLVDMIERVQRGGDILARNVYPTISGAIGQVKYLQATARPADLETKTSPAQTPVEVRRRNSAQQSPRPPSRSSVIEVP